MPHPRMVTPRLYGIWNGAAGAWVLGEDGRRFETRDADRALDTLSELLHAGAVGLRVRVIPEP